MNKKLSFLVMPVIALALSTVFIGCASPPTTSVPAPSQTQAVAVLSEPDIPEIDYSRIGPNDSVILAYLDPLLVKTFKPSDTIPPSEMLTFVVWVDSTRYYSPPMVNIRYSPRSPYVNFVQSFQMQIPNGSHTLHVVASRGATRTGDILPFEVDFDNIAVTYKIRLATNEEKRAGGLGLGNEVYTMEEVAQRKLR